MWFCMGHSEVNGLKYIVLFLWVNMEEVKGGGVGGVGGIMLIWPDWVTSENPCFTSFIT